MKVLIIINNLGIGGAERLVVDDINEMSLRGIDVHLVTLAPERDESFMREVELGMGSIHTVSFISFKDLATWIKLITLIKEIRPTVIFTHLWQANTIGRIAGFLVGNIKIVTFEHNIYDSLKTRKMFLVDVILQFISYKIVAVSGAVRDSLILHHIKKNKIIVVNNGINTTKYRASAKAKRLALGIPEKNFIFLTVGRLIHQKGIDVLIKAFSKISKDSSLLIAGEGPDELMLKKLANNLGVASRVTFLGFRRDMPQVLSSCDCFVLASRYEGLGIVVLEAMAAERPVIISDFNAGKDILKDGFDGLVVEKENVDSLAKSMELMMLNEELRDFLRRNASKKVEHYSIRQHVDRILMI